MASSSSSSTTQLSRCRPHQETLVEDTVLYRFPIRLFCVKPKAVFTSRQFGAILSTGDPYSVVLPFFSKDDIKIFSEKVHVSFTPTWFGIPCKFVKIRIGLPVLESPYPRPFVLLALLPLDLESIPQDIPPLLRLGSQFLVETNSQLHLPANEEPGKLVIPY